MIQVVLVKNVGELLVLAQIGATIYFVDEICEPLLVTVGDHFKFVPVDGAAVLTEVHPALLDLILAVHLLRESPGE